MTERCRPGTGGSISAEEQIDVWKNLPRNSEETPAPDLAERPEHRGAVEYLIYDLDQICVCALCALKHR